MPFAPCLSVKDTATTLAFFAKLGFDADSSTASPGDDIHMLLYKGQFCAMIYSNADLKNWLPVLADTPIGFAGMFYLAVDDIDQAYNQISTHAEIVKPMTADNNGQRMFYFRDPDGYVIGINDKAALDNSELSKYVEN
ncbi:VOC family protein [Nocardia terpenica]|uniref:VOC family protein n=1 Tax=Nocardia terpenica TaxID=455432 RepID=UPI001895D4C7|nr:VOC family protein [Nocardia terpenica]MBF6061273.1 VOC family protein [Nocardia terpenica]MBF6105498.1 VOC family protein [Nocardia terpenica]MBF6113032.1 VOC family protein [Nocardia terpenica]MBF6119162.1 VOC family protein [Nocardia terpenica]MBF6152810.1 VOC family protein [Nocardia terpenica]